MLILLILAPLLWVLRFKDYRCGFVSVSALIIALNAGVSLSLQSLSLFNFNFLLSVHILIALISIFFNWKPFFEKIKLFKFSYIKKIPWVFVIAISIIAFQLYSVHFNYTGKISTLNGIIMVEDFKSGHPYFSDEWIAIGMSEQSIESGKLPFTNFLNGATFINFLFVFHSLISGLDLLFDLNLVTDYQLLSIFFSLVLITFSYILIREYKVSIGISIFTIFLLSYLPNSSNLPLLWYLLPWNIGLIFFLVYLFSVRKGYLKTSILFNLLSISFYPPILIMAIPSLFVYVLKIKDKSVRLKIFVWYIILILIGLISAALFVSFGSSDAFTNVINSIQNFLYRNLDSVFGEPPLFIIWRVVPWFITPFAFWTLWKVRHTESYLSAPVFIGLILWFLYSIKTPTFLMDYHRTVAVTSILMVIISAFSLESFKNYILEKYKTLDRELIKQTSIVLLLILFMTLSFSFTKRDGWENFKTLHFSPAPPANNYLHSDDLKLFEGIHNERFLATPWKGLILGVTTDNVPIITKPSTLTINLTNYDKFMVSDCDTKQELVKKLKVNYVYTPEFKCDGFELVGKSAEGFHLYLVR